MRSFVLAMRALNSPPRALRRLLMTFTARATTLTTTAVTPIPVPMTDSRRVASLTFCSIARSRAFRAAAAPHP